MTTSRAEPTRIELVDDHKVVRAGLRMLLESVPGFVIAGEAADGSEALSTAQREQPDIILLDLALGKENGLDFLPDLLSVAPAARTIILTGVRDPEVHTEAVRRGARGVVLKEQAAEVLVTAIQRVRDGEVWLDPSLIARVFGEVLNQKETREADPDEMRIASLTERECEVISVICEGLPNKEIARRLSISEMTVAQHLRSIYNKLGVQNRLELVIYAYRHDLAKPPR